jgi:outer membrane protein insertion porin family
LKGVKVRVFAILLATGLLTSAVAQERVITRIEFSPAEQPYERAELDQMILPLRVGQLIKDIEVRSAIQNLYRSGRYADIAIEGDPDGTLRVVTTPVYFLSRVAILGENDPPNANQLQTAAQLDLGTRFENAAVEAAVSRIQERLRANGLYDASVLRQVNFTDATQEAAVFFDITPGKRARFGGIELTGQALDAAEKSTLELATDWRRGISFVRLPGWRVFDETRLQSGIDDLLRRLQRDDRLQARVSLERLDYDAALNRVTPVLAIERGPVIEVRTSGAEVSKSRLRQLIPIYQERAVDRALLLEGQRNLTAYFQERGYFDAAVTFRQEEPAPGLSLIEYQVDRGQKHRLRNITMAGNKYFDTATLRQRMFIEPASRLRFRAGRYSPRLLAQDVAALRGLYQSNGFRDATVTPTVTESVADHGDLRVDLEIVEGRQWFVNKLTLTGVSAENEPYVLPLLRSTEGQPFSATTIAEDRDALLTYYFNNGYPEATFSMSLTEDVADGRVDVAYTVQPGKLQTVRGVMIRGLDTTDAALVESRLLVRAGDPLSRSQIGESQQKLYDLGIFAKVQTATQNPDGEEDAKYVLFHVEEARKYSFNYGFGAEIARIGGGTTSLSTPTGAAGFAPRVSLGLSRINFLGLGHTIGLQTQISTQQKRALLNYLAPQFKGKPDLALTFTALFNDARDVRTFTARRWEASTQLSQRFSRSNTGQLRYTFRRVTLDENSLNIASELIPLVARPVRVGLVGATFFRDRRDDPVNSKRGTYNTLDVAVAAAMFGSQTSFTRLIARNSTYHPLRRDIILARTVQFGLMRKTEGQAEIPLAERFFAGGASSQRAFPDNQAGPRDLLTGFPVGGSALLFHSTELRFPLIGDNIGAVLFHDMGNVFSSLGDISLRFRQRDLRDFNYGVHAVGAGVRYQTPVGPVRVDLAFSPNTPRFFGFGGTRDQLLNAPSGVPLCAEASALCVNQRISRFQFHFSLGQTF